MTHAILSDFCRRPPGMEPSTCAGRLETVNPSMPIDLDATETFTAVYRCLCGHNIVVSHSNPKWTILNDYPANPPRVPAGFVAEV